MSVASVTPPESLFKYLPFARHSILKDGRVRFSQASAFNDPFELRPSFDLMSKADIASLPLAPDAAPNEPNRVLTPEWIAAMVQVAMPTLDQVSKNAQPGAAYSLDNNKIAHNWHNKRWGILSLSDRPANLLMWAHYADNHRGFVIQFNGRHEFFRTGAMGPVEYSETRPIVSITTLDSPEVYFRKSCDWSYEREWRLVRPLIEADTTIETDTTSLHFFDIPPGAITGVITGAMMAEQDYRELCDLAQSERWGQVNVHHAQLSREHFQIEITPPVDGVPLPPNLDGQTLHAR